MREAEVSMQYKDKSTRVGLIEIHLELLELFGATFFSIAHGAGNRDAQNADIAG